MTAQSLIIIGTSILGVLGLIHFVYVFATRKFDAFDAKVTKAMQGTTLVLTKDTTMWRAWIGFNYSHSFGIFWITLIYLPMAIFHMDWLQQSFGLSLLLPIIAASYALLAKKYWFNVPFIGSLISLACFSVAFYWLHLS